MIVEKPLFFPLRNPTVGHPVPIEAGHPGEPGLTFSMSERYCL